MLERIMDYFWAEPDRFETHGDGLMAIGWIWLVGGGIATAAVFIVSTATHASGMTLETLFPGLPAWLLPETLAGTLPGLLPLIAGARLKAFGARYRAQY